MSLDFRLTVTVTEEKPVFDWMGLTHNLHPMAAAAGIGDILWRDDNGEMAWTLIEPLRKGLADLKARPDHFKQFEPANGWGDYDGLVRFVTELLDACEKYPHAKIETCR